jgi:hypothetical protein
VYGSGYDEPGFGPRRQTVGKKRPNPEEQAALEKSMGDTEYAVSSRSKSTLDVFVHHKYCTVQL